MTDDIFISRLGFRYTFNYSEAPDGWRGYIRAQPSYAGRPSDCHSTHRYRDANGHHFVCWTTRLNTLREARAVAHFWADCTDIYRALGIFPRKRDGIAAWVARLLRSLS